MRYLLSAILFVALLPVSLWAQNYSDAWKEVDSLIDKQYYSQAYDKSQKLYDSALEANDSWNSLLGAYYLSQSGSYFKENMNDSTLVRYTNLLSQLKGKEKMLCHMFLASFYSGYYSDNRWRVASNNPTDETDLEYKLWDKERFHTTVGQHLQQAFSDKGLLKETKAGSLGSFVYLLQSGDDGDLTPSLFDVMVLRANDVYRQMSYPKLNESNFDNINDLAANTDRFAKIKLNSLDSTQEMSAFIMSLNQERELFHQASGSSDRVMIRLYLDRLNGKDYYVALGNNKDMLLQELPSVLAKFRPGNDESISLLYYKLADVLNSQDRAVEAVALLDTAISLHPQGRGVENCYNFKIVIQKPFININVPSVVPSERYGLATVEVKNVDTLFFRIADYLEDEYIIDQDYHKKLLSSKTYQQWELPVVDRHDYKTRNLYFAFPPLPRGHYVLMASYNRLFDTIISFSSLRIEDIAIVKSDGDRLSGFIVNRKDGKPVKGMKVTLEGGRNRRSKTVTLATTETDDHGHFSFADKKALTSKYYWTLYKVNHNGQEIEETVSVYGRDAEHENQKYDLFFDRPVYKPADTVHFSLFGYAKKDNDGRTLSDVKDMLVVYNINGKAVDTIPILTDEFGTASGSYALPADAMPGHWQIRQNKNHNSWSFKVEAYKQPKFTVTLSHSAEMRSFGTPSHIEGVAASYSAVPISGAKVTYSIERHEKQPFWRWGWWHWWHPVETKVVVTGDTVTDENGFFNIVFTPLPDSVSDLSRKPVFEYTVNVAVTDINGETHEATTSLAVGYENSYLKISVYDDTVNISHLNLEGNSLQGEATLTVESLQSPSKALLHNEIFDYKDEKMEMPYSRKEFERMFPLLDYMDSTADHTLWPVSKTIYSGKSQILPDKPYRYSLTGQKAGVYKLTARMVTGQGDTLETTAIYKYEPKDSKMPVGNDLFVTHIEDNNCPVGDTVHLRVGSRHNDVTVYLLVRKSEKYYQYGTYNVSQGYVSIDVPVTDSLLGGFTIEMAAMKENLFVYQDYNITVPFVDKILDVRLETFRDKLIPGEPERWTLRVKEKYSGLPVRANVLMTMYDAALDNYGSLFFNSTIWSQSYTYHVFNQINSIERSYSVIPVDRPRMGYLGNYQFHIYELVNNHSDEMVLYCIDGVAARSGSNSLRRVSKVGSVRGESGIDEEMGLFFVEEEAAEAEESVVLTNEMATPKSAMQFSLDDLADSGESEEQPLYLRQNLSTLALFCPTLRSDADGAVEISFQAPDLLTRWNIRGYAWTKDLKEGTLRESVVTQKPLMVTPNVPRFLRHGDTCRFVVKVSNMDDKEQNVSVTLRMTNADGGAVLSMIAGDSVRNITLGAGRSGEVSFLLAVPREPIFVANYRVVAYGQGCSDGEQAPIPLLPSRQLVTESMAFYINGAGEKHYNMKHLSELDTSSPGLTLFTRGLTVDLTPNPIWMVMQSLPYVQQRQNPSNIYLANAIYTNSLSYYIVNNNPQIVKIFNEWSETGYDAFISELDRNSDLKQTVIDETPWLRDAVSEEQRHRDVARFFNKTAIEHQLRKDLNRLVDSQRPDGGWSWIDGCSYSSLYTTQYVLKTFGLLRQQGVDIDSRTMRALNKAMDYVDRETYNYYKKYIKNRGYDVVNLDYLYLRSYYTDNKLSNKQKEAYDFFYNNAKKYNETYRSLFTQSMLSVIFNRGGDKKLAEEMAKRIKEKALYSDEMGMYWRDNVGGWRWNERPIETQAMLIRTMNEVLGDRESVAKMQQWILKQKQTTNWNTDVSTVNAIQALLSGQETSDSPIRIKPSRITLTFGSHQLSTDTTRHQLHVSQRLDREEVTPADGHLTIRKEDDGIAWGAIYWQYFEQVDKIPSSSMGVTLKRTLYRVERDGKLSRMSGSDGLKVGDKVRVRIEIMSDRTLEYLELRDPRPAAFEPVNTESGWRWNNGISFYCSVTNTAHTLYIDRLEKGTYSVEYDFYVNNAGTYTTAPTTIQCLYAPEFRSLCPFPLLKVE